VFKLSGNSLLRLALIICPFFEKNLSAGTEVAGIMMYFNAISFNG